MLVEGIFKVGIIILVYKIFAHSFDILSNVNVLNFLDVFFPNLSFLNIHMPHFGIC